MADLLKEALADAKALRETSLKNAKITLAEAFTPKIKEMFSEKVAALDEEESLGEEFEVEEAKKSEEDELDLDETKKSEEDDEDLEEAKKSEEDDEDLEEAKKKDDKDEDETDPELDEILREFEMEEAKKSEDSKEEVEDDLEEAKSDKDRFVGDEDEIDLDEILEELENESSVSEVKELSELKSTVRKQEKVINELRTELNEISLLNSKLLFANKIFNKYSLNPKQKMTVLEALDRSNTIKEAKLVYVTLCESYSKVNKPVGNLSKLTESIASRKAGKGIIKEGQDASVSPIASRFQELANL